MNLLEIAKLFSDDIKEYIKEGGSLDDLDPVKIYKLEDDEEK